MRRSMSSLWWRDSNQTASGNPARFTSTKCGSDRNLLLSSARHKTHPSHVPCGPYAFQIRGPSRAPGKPRYSSQDLLRGLSFNVRSPRRACVPGREFLRRDYRPPTSTNRANRAKIRRPSRLIARSACAIALMLGECRGRAVTVRVARQVHIYDGVSSGHPEVGIRRLPACLLRKHRHSSLRNQSILLRCAPPTAFSSARA